jgi:hypothetical protein
MHIWCLIQSHIISYEHKLHFPSHYIKGIGELADSMMISENFCGDKWTGYKLLLNLELFLKKLLLLG